MLMSLKEITYDPCLLPIKSLRQSGHFQLLNKEKRYLCKCIAIRNIVFGMMHVSGLRVNISCR